MDFQGQPRESHTVNPNASTPANDFHAMRPPMPQIPFFQGFPSIGNQMPYLFPHPFNPPASGAPFTSPSQANPNVTIDLTEDTHKRVSQECVTEQSKPKKKKRAIRKKSEIVDLDKLKEDVDLLKNATHWKDHWVIQLITIRGEMHNTFSQPPKQGIRLSSLIFFCSFLFVHFFSGFREGLSPP